MSRPTRPPTGPVSGIPEASLLPDELVPHGEVERKFRGAQITGVQRYTPIMMLGNVVNAGLFVWVAAHAGLTPFALSWLCLILLYSAMAIRSWRRSRRFVRRGASERVARRAVVHAFVLGTA